MATYAYGHARPSPRHIEAARAALTAQRNTAIRLAAVRDRAGAWTRDVPASCICDWAWASGLGRYTLTSLTAGCPWHWDVDL